MGRGRYAIDQRSDRVLTEEVDKGKQKVNGWLIGALTKQRKCEEEYPIIRKVWERVSCQYRF
ncbi:MAG: hypothetical protein VYD50_03685, partial [Candidatus Thermoplasmatota archaeon]|nr:hypothetical protein [Candidatus Thermoplasmatota archaeon]